MTEGPSLKSVLVQGSLAYAMRRASVNQHGMGTLDRRAKGTPS
jgi:hypothetical protein